MSWRAIQGGFNKCWEQKNKHISPNQEGNYHKAMSNLCIYNAVQAAFCPFFKPFDHKVRWDGSD